jgi:chromosomal replication initiation ATPase DnaA
MSNTTGKEKRITSAEVVKAVCDYHNVPIALVKSEARSYSLVHVRYEIAYILKHKMGFSFPRIGKVLNRSHSTVIYWLIKASKRRNAPGQAQIDIAETVWSNLTGG